MRLLAFFLEWALTSAFILVITIQPKREEIVVEVKVAATISLLFTFLNMYDPSSVSPKYRSLIDYGSVRYKKTILVCVLLILFFKATSRLLGIFILDTNTVSVSSLVVTILFTYLCTYNAYIPSAKLLPLISHNSSYPVGDLGGSTISDLHIDALQAIYEKLGDVKDYIRFGVVCKKWQTVVLLSPNNIPFQLPVHIPLNPAPHNDPLIDIISLLPIFNWLFGEVPLRHSFNVQSLCRILRTLKQINVCRNIDILGTGYGWLFIAETSKIQLVNFFLSADNVIQLPSLHRARVKKVTLSHDPRTTSNYSVMIIYQNNDGTYRLAFTRSGDKSWTDIYQDITKLGDIISYKNQFYAISYSGTLLLSDITKERQPRVTEVAVLSGYGPKYLVESSGDLLCVRKDVHKGLQVFKLENGLKWIQEKTLRGHAIFISPCAVCVSILAAHFRQCKPNHIYYSDGYDTEVFDVEDATFQSFSGMEIGPIWVEPTLNKIESDI